MINLRILGLSAFACAVVGAGSASAQETARPAALEALVACRAQADDAARLACFDAAATALDTAERTGEVTVVDRAQVQATRRSFFGLEGGDLNIFRGRGGEEVTTLETTLSSAAQGRDGWVFTLADGSVWRQVDDEQLRVRPRSGMTVSIRRAALGSYMLSVDGARSLRARRDR